jgi:hypothetical protein
MRALASLQLSNHPVRHLPKPKFELITSVLGCTRSGTQIAVLSGKVYVYVHWAPRRVFVESFLAIRNAMSPVSKTTKTSRRDTPVTTSAASASPHQLKKTHKLEQRPPFDSVALLLQGGGALGAYQAGVYEALAEADLHPDWVAGISIGAINSAIIVGNPREPRVAKLRDGNS